MLNIFRHNIYASLTMPIDANTRQYEALMAAYTKDIAAFQSGNKSAGTRARKSLMEMAKLAKVLRGEITEQKNKA
jgi:hypothetical protein